MKQQIKQLEAAARFLEPDEHQRQQLLDRVAAYSQEYLESIANAPANGTHADGRDLLASPIAEQGIDISEALDLLRENVDTTGISTTSGRFLGYIPGGALFPAALGDYLAAIANRYAGHYFASPGAVRMENMLLDWMAEVVGYPKISAGNLTSGGSIANLVAIVAARDTHLISGERLTQAVVYLTEHAHHSVRKALHIAGLDGTIQRRIPVDARYRMDADLLEKAILADRAAGLYPWLIIAAAGTTNTGSVDPLLDLGQIAADHGLWFHVDGSYGAFFCLCREGQEALRGMHGSDSLVMDPHKTLFLPYGAGAVLVKDGSKLYASQNFAGAYMQDIPDDIEELSPADLSPELTKHFRGLRLWLPLKLFGLAPFRAALSEKILLARYFHEQIGRLPGFEAGPFPDLSVVTYRYLPERGDADAFNQRLVQDIQKDGRIFISSTQIDGRFILRLAIGSFRTHLDDIDLALEVLQSSARRLVETGS
jgi:aromatic-L-amino-acid decarboxylase